MWDSEFALIVQLKLRHDEEEQTMKPCFIFLMPPGSFNRDKGKIT